jgi:hypothetical protein
MTAGSIGTLISDSLADFDLRGSADFVGYRMSFVPRERPRIACNGPGPDQKQKLRSGIVVQIVVLAHCGEPRVFIDEDTWNVKTEDGTDSALFSHLIVVRQDGSDVLTREY